MNETYTYRLILYNSKTHLISLLLSFVLLILTVIIFSFRIWIFITYPLVLISIIILLRKFAVQMITVQISHEQLLIKYYNLTRTAIKSQKEIQFANIKSISRIRYALREIISIKQENGKTIKFKKAYYGIYAKSDDFRQLLDRLKALNLFKKVYLS